MEIALNLGLCDAVLASGPDNVAEVRQLTGGMGVERAVDCSANDAARATAHSRHAQVAIVFLGEGGRVEFNPSPDLIHDQKTLYGSWVTSTWLMEELVEPWCAGACIRPISSRIVFRWSGPGKPTR